MASFSEQVFSYQPATIQTVFGKESSKVESGKKTLIEIKKLFGRIALGKQNYVNPGAVLAALVDDNGRSFQVG